MSYNLVNPTTGALTRVAGSDGTLYADTPIGSIVPFGGSLIPGGYLLCNGQAVSRTAYSELFAAIGTAFGSGDGSTTFNIPDMRESVPKGAGLTGKTVGAHVKTGGLAIGEFLDDRVQEHTHTYTDHFTGKTLSATSSGNVIGSDDSTTRTTDPNSGRSGATTEVKSVGVNYIIKAKMVEVPIDFLDKVDEAVGEAIVDYNQYSTTEAVVGKWIDGKPIYRRVFNITATQDNQHATILPSGATAIRCFANGVRKDNRKITLPYMPADNFSYVSDIYMWEDEYYFRAGNGFIADYCPMQVKLIVEYTKTTD